MLRKLKKVIKPHDKKKSRVQVDSGAATPSPTLSHTSLSINSPGQDTLAPCNVADPISRASSTDAVTSPHTPIHLIPCIPAPLPSADPLLVTCTSSHQPSITTTSNNNSTLSVAGPPSYSSSPTLLAQPSGEHSVTELHRPPIGGLAQGDIALPDKSALSPSPPTLMENVLKVGKTILKTFSVLAGAPALDSFLESLEEEQPLQSKEGLDEFCGQLMKSVQGLMELKTSQKLKDNLEEFYSTLSQIPHGEKNGMCTEIVCRKIMQAMHSFMLVNCISGVVKIEDTLISVEKHVLHQCIQNLPHVDAAYNDYESKKKSGACFEGTRESLLAEIAVWISALETVQIYFLSGIAGIGKSTVVYTVAERAERIGYLGASFFFSRDEVERSNAKRFFTTIAFQLCLYDREFAQAIEKALLTERGLAAIAKDPITQLEALILEPLRDIVRSRSTPIVTVVDALDECDDRDAPIVLAALNRLVQELPYFKVILTARPLPHLAHNPSSHKIFHLQNIEDKVVDSDIRRYLEYNLSRPQVSVCMPNLAVPWNVSEDDLKLLVKAAGRLFIIASTAVRFILDTTTYDPQSQIEALEMDGCVSLDGLENFYGAILRRAVPLNKPMIAQRFRSVIGTIFVLQEPLSVEALEGLTQSRPSSAVRAVLANLQSVIALSDDTPRIYHKSFFDYLTNPEHCPEDLLIDMKEHHTRLATRCFEIMNKSLRQNILDLDTPARFMSNDAGVGARQLSLGQMQEKMPAELRYACLYWANHIERAGPGDAHLLREVNIFINEHLLHWLEVLSWIGGIDMATHALRVILNSMKLDSSNMGGIISDAMHFIQKFYECIRRSALHTYYSALPFAPTESLLFKGHSKEMTQCLCRPEGVPTQWGALIARTDWHNSTDELPVQAMFSDDSSKLALSDGRMIRLSNAENGSVFLTLDGKGKAVSMAHNFSAAALSDGRTVTVVDNVRSRIITAPTDVVKLALSFDGRRLAVGSSDRKVSLWDSRTGEFIACLVGFSHQLEFATSGYRLAYVSDDHRILLWDGYNGELVARLNYMWKRPLGFIFSRDGCYLSSLVKEDKGYSLTLWGGEKGNLIGVAEDVGFVLAISEDSSLIAAARGTLVRLWSVKPFSLLNTLDVGESTYSLAISRGVLAIGSSNALRLYDINNCIFTAALQGTCPRQLAFSPDCTRLSVSSAGSVSLYDVRSLKAPTPASSEQPNRLIVTLAFSPDSTRLASGFNDGTIQLWDTSRIEQPISSQLCPSCVTTVAFSRSGDQFASGSDETLQLWDGKDGAPIHQRNRSLTHWITSVAYSCNFLAAATDINITLFDPESLRIVHMLEKGASSLSFSEDGSFLASSSCMSDVTVWNVMDWVAMAVFKVDSGIDSLMLSPDGSQLAACSERYGFQLFDVAKRQAIEPAGQQDLHWHPNFTNGVLMSWTHTYGNCLLGRFPGHPDWVPVLWIPREFNISCFAVGSSIVALGGAEGRILFIRLS